MIRFLILAGLLCLAGCRSKEHAQDQLRLALSDNEREIARIVAKHPEAAEAIKQSRVPISADEFEPNDHPSDELVREFMERQRAELRRMSAHATEKQREFLRAHVEFYADEIRAAEDDAKRHKNDPPPQQGEFPVAAQPKRPDVYEYNTKTKEWSVLDGNSLRPWDETKDGPKPTPPTVIENDDGTINIQGNVNPDSIVQPGVPAVIDAPTKNRVRVNASKYIHEGDIPRYHLDTKKMGEDFPHITLQGWEMDYDPSVAWYRFKGTPYKSYWLPVQLDDKTDMRLMLPCRYDEKANKFQFLEGCVWTADEPPGAKRFKEVILQTEERFKKERDET